MIIIHDLSGEKPRTRLENAHIVEKCKNKIQETERPENFDKMSSDKMINLTIDLAQIELKGISDYIIQILSFINGYNLAELPYIVHALKKVTEKLIDICRDTDKQVGETAMEEKIEALWELYGDSKIVIDRVMKTADKKNEEE